MAAHTARVAKTARPTERNDWPPQCAANAPATAPMAVPASRVQDAQSEPPRLACITMTAVTTAQ